MGNLGNFIVGGIVVLIVLFAIWKMVKDHREEKCCGGSCSGGCAGCHPASNKNGSGQ